MPVSSSDDAPIFEDEPALASARGQDKRRPQQVELFKLLRRTFRRTWGDWFQQEIMQNIHTPLIILSFILLTLLLLVVIFVFTSLVSGTLAQIAIWLAASLAFVLAFQRTAEIESSVIHRLSDQISLGRLSVALDTNRMESVLLGVLIGTQWALLACGRWPMGMPVEKMTLGTALGYTFDNFTHGVLGDICELYDWRIMPEFQHTFWSATSFSIFRTAASVLALLWIRLAWQRFLARRLFRQFPANCTYQGMIDWLRGLSRTEQSWMLSNFDEFLFLRIAGEYLANDFSAVQRLTTEFPRLRVDNNVRELFVDAEGHILFQGFAT